MTETRRAQMMVSFDLLKSLLELPIDTRIIGVEPTPGYRVSSTCTLIFEHPKLRLVKEGEDIPQIEPEWKMCRGRKAMHWGQE